MAFMPYLATLDLLSMPKVNGVYRLYVSFNNPLLYWLHNTVCSKYSLDKITKREIIKRLFCHVIHGDMTSQLDITWQRGETIAKYLFISIWKLANGMAQNNISGVNLSALYVAWYINGYRRGIKTKPHLLLHISMIFHSATQHGNHSPFGVVVSMLGASWSIMENMQQPCGFALQFTGDWAPEMPECRSHTRAIKEI